MAEFFLSADGNMICQDIQSCRVLTNQFKARQRYSLIVTHRRYMHHDAKPGHTTITFEPLKTVVLDVGRVKD